MNYLLTEFLLEKSGSFVTDGLPNSIADEMAIELAIKQGYDRRECQSILDHCYGADPYDQFEGQGGTI